MIALTGATGQLGRLVLEELIALAHTPAAALAALVRSPEKAAHLAARGVSVRRAPYTDAAALRHALEGVEKLLLVSSSEIGQRVAQHANVVAAARDAGVRLLVYTSLLHADTSEIDLATEHRATEAAIRASGIPYVILRNGWYTENYTAALPAVLAHGAVLGSAGTGRISLAARADYASAAVAALTGRVPTGTTLELAGDTAVTLAEFAAEIARLTGRDIVYRDLPEAEYAALLRQFGFPEPIASAFPGWDAAASRGALFDDSRTLGRLIGRPTTPVADTIRAAL
ncbi:SDR family oxidoreductase [Opitutales bacterium ASA1]|uniref:NAD(P)H-binding protein n=1 Tax=Congregicoccus parvus TaxID=3081749 RepID=UPI002B2C14BD|nr:SDR family oxidoreductase [Opitutales bacterium ASA1]